MIFTKTTDLLVNYYIKSCIYFYIIQLYILFLMIKYFISRRNANINLLNYIKDFTIFILIFISYNIIIDLLNNITLLLKFF
jgi:hypothetical protein